MRRSGFALHRLLLAGLCSVLLHAIALVLLTGKDQSPADEAPVISATFEWVRAAPTNLPTPNAEQAANPLLHELPEIAQASEQPPVPQPLPDPLNAAIATPAIATPVIETPAIETRTDQSAQTAAPPHLGLTLSRSLLSGISTETAADAWQAFNAEACTPAQHHADLYNCPAQAALLEDPTAQFYADLLHQTLAHLDNRSPSLKRDLDRAGALLAQAEQLAALNPSDQVQAALVREQRALISQQVMDIDRRYSQFNLLRLLPIGAKVLKGLQQQAEGG